MCASVQPNTAQYSPDSLRQSITSQYSQILPRTAHHIPEQPRSAQYSRAEPVIAKYSPGKPSTVEQSLL